MLYRFGGFSLDTGRFELVFDGDIVPVEPQALKLIAYLIENRDRAVSRDELQQHLWGARIVSDNALSVCVKTARTALGDDGRRQSLIRTVPRVGYRFIADVDVRSFARIEIENRDSVQDGPGELELRDAALLARPSVVILPFVTIGESPTSTVLSQGLTHDITTRIARTRSAFVIARGTAFQFEGQYPDVRDIGRMLGVRYVVHGAVQRSGKKMRITATLADSASREEIWSDNFERGIDDFVAVQEELANLIVAFLQSELERAERLRSLLIPSTNLDAWSAFHRGCWHMYRFRSEDIDHAERFFRQSVDLEPTVPRPYAGLSFIHFERVFLNIDADPASGTLRAMDYAQQALAIDPLDPMAHWALSRAYLLQGNLDASKQSLETAIELNPSYAIAQYSLGWVAAQLGQRELCKSRIEMARKLSPYDPLTFAMLGMYGLNLALMGRTEEAVTFAGQAVAQPNAHHQTYAVAAISHALDGQLRKGAELLGRVRAIVPEYTSQNFFAMCTFKETTDIARITRAFHEIERYSKAH